MFTAQADGGSGNYEYRFTLNGPATSNAPQVVQNYSATNSWTWTTTAADVGSSTITADARNLGSNSNAEATASAAFTINAPPNTSPTANAGADQTVNGGAAVTLSGSGSDTDGTIVSYAWAQTAGPAVTLNGVPPTANFTAPSVTAVTVLTFRLTVTDNQGATGSDTVNITVNPAPASSNIAPLATVTASSENVNGDQGAIKAVDGVAEGYPENRTAEWRTSGQTVGAWLNLVWSSAHTIDRVVLYDRPNLNDQITSATLSFSDGSSVSVGTLANNGTGVTVSFPARTVTSLLLTVTGVSGTTLNVGLAEIEVYSTPAGGTNQPPTANAGADQTVSQGVLVQLNGGASSDPESVPLTYTWTQTAGPAVGLVNAASATPSFTAPSGLSQNTVLTFQLVVSDGALSSAPDLVDVTVQATQTASNIAPLATVTASSENVNGDQGAIKAVDGVAEGYPENRTAEWRTSGQTVGAWLNLVWSSAHTIDRVVLYDRPNLNDQITSATLSFSDGSSVSVGTLANNGTGVTVSFPARTVTSLLLTVTGVSGTTLNVGLAEIEVFGY